MVGCANNQTEGEDEGGPSLYTPVECHRQAKAQRVLRQRPDPIGPSSECMSYHSMEVPLLFQGRPSSAQEMVQKLRLNFSDCSTISDQSKNTPLAFQEVPSTEDLVEEITSNESVKESQADLDALYMLLEKNVLSYVKNEFKNICKLLNPNHPECLRGRQYGKELDGMGEEQWRSCREAFLKFILHLLRGLKHHDWANQLEKKSCAATCPLKLKSHLKKRARNVFEGDSSEGNTTPLTQIYTELYITNGESENVNNQHEFRQIEVVSKKQETQGRPIKLEDLFTVSTVRTVMTKGGAGIGKTILTQKFTLDWAEDKANHHIQFTFPFTFRELNVLREKKFSLVELVHDFYPEVKKTRICRFEGLHMLFIFDGLDESRLPLDFEKTKVLTDVTESTTLDVLLTNLIRGDLLPSARLWITTRPAAANQIPPEYVSMMTEIRGFADQQKEEYFTKKIRDEEQASRIIRHIKTSRSLHIMCHIPVFCWLTATVLEEFLTTSERGELPRTLTEMYIHFLVVQTKRKMIKYDEKAETDPHWSPENKKMIEALGKLAFEQLQKGNLIFYESDLTESGIDIEAAAKYTGVFTEIFKEETGLCQGKMFSFIHLSVQEFLGALHVHLTFINSGVNLFKEKNTNSKFLNIFTKTHLKNLHISAVDMALQSPNGHLDLCLRFLLGLSLQNNQCLLRGLLTPYERSSQTNKETIQYIKKKINSGSVEKSLNLFHCLNELNDSSLVEEIQQFLTSGWLDTDKLSPAQWSTLVFILLSSEEELDVFDMKKYSSSEEVLLRLLPVVKASRKALLDFCTLTGKGFEALSSVLSSTSNLQELDLSNNNLLDEGVKLLFDGLLSPDCKLETLRLSGCFLTDGNLHALRLQSSSLRQLDLSNNNLQDTGMKLLTDGLKGPQCNLETLSLSICNLSERSCEGLSSVLTSESSGLKELDLSNNNIQDSGVNLLSAAIESPRCKLEILRLSGCLITEEGCASLDSALTSNPSHLKEIDLTYNHLGDCGAKPLSAKLEDPKYGLKTLRTEPAGEQWLRPGLGKYVCKLQVNTNTVNGNVKLSDNTTKVTYENIDQEYPDHPERFTKNQQLLCENALTGRCYWEVELTGGVHVSVSYRGISRGGETNDGWFGGNDQSWSLFASDGYSVWHNKKGTPISFSSCSSSSSTQQRIAVYMDHPAGTLSFYRVSSDSLIHLHTFTTTFTEPLYPGFGLWSWSGLPQASSVCLSPL